MQNPWENPRLKVFVDRERATDKQRRNPPSTSSAPHASGEAHRTVLRQPAGWLIASSIGAFVILVLLFVAWAALLPGVVD